MRYFVRHLHYVRCMGRRGRDLTSPSVAVVGQVRIRERVAAPHRMGRAAGGGFHQRSHTLHRKRVPEGCALVPQGVLPQAPLPVRPTAAFHRPNAPLFPPARVYMRPCGPPCLGPDLWHERREWVRTPKAGRMVRPHACQRVHLRPPLLPGQHRLRGRVGGADPRRPSISKSYIAPLFVKMAQNLDLRCVLVPAPWVLGPKHVSNPE